MSSILRTFYLKGLLLGKHFLSTIHCHNVIRLIPANADIDSAKATNWATTEPGTGIVAASLATLRPLFRAMTEATRGNRHNKTGQDSQTRNIPRISRTQLDEHIDNVA